MPRSLDYIETEILRVAEELGIEDPRSSDFTRKLFTDNSDVTKHDLEHYGGFTKVKHHTCHAAGVVNSKAQPLARGVELNNLYVRKLERTVATRDYFSEKVSKNFEEIVKKYPVKLNTGKYKPKTRKATKKILNLLWSDLHFGVDVKSYEVYANEYDWTIASRRMAFLCAKAVEEAEETTELRIFLNGDIMQGVIHLNDANIKCMTEQIWGAASILIQAIDFLKRHFGKVQVICLPGNHDRMTYRDATRATTQRWDSHAHSLYLALKSAFRSTDVEFDIPTTGMALVDDLNGGYILATHGDVEPDPRNVSKKIDTEKMATDFVKMKESQALDRPVSVALFGHWHTPTVQMLPTGAFVVVNGCLIGSEPYGQYAIGIYNNIPAQLMFSSVPGNPFHSVQVVKVKEADSDSSLDSIIAAPKIFENGQMKV